MLKIFLRVVFLLMISLPVTNGQLNHQIRAHFDFESPVKHDYKLSGNFCELRNSHFHGGLDIKQSGTGKDTIFSIGDGYISRIRISPDGYGQALYIDHPASGLTSVYAHLDGFSSTIDNYIRQYQFLNESYDTDLHLSAEIFPVRKGEFVGLMGNTGHSFGKHLHFELRETATDKVLNPYLMGFGISDNIPPTLLKLQIHGLDSQLHKVWEKPVNLSPYHAETIELSGIVSVPASRAGISLNAYDRINGSANRQGLYAIRLYVNDTLVYSSVMDKLPAEQSRYIKGFVDYGAKLKNQGMYYLCYRYPGNDVSLIQHERNGIIDITTGDTKNVVLEVEDFAGNARKIKLQIQRSDTEKNPVEPPVSATLIEVHQNADVVIKNLNVSFRKNSLFRNIYLELDTVIQTSKNTLYRIHKRDEPIKTPLKIGITPDITIPDRLFDKAIIIREGSGTRWNCGGSWNGRQLETTISEFGNYTLGFDTIPPRIKPISFLQKAGKFSQFRFSIADNLPVLKNGYTNAMHIKVWIDDTFHICPFDAKSQTLTIPLRNLEKGKHNLTIEVKDHSQNTAYFNSEFYR